MTCVLFFTSNDTRSTRGLAVLLQSHVQTEQILGILAFTDQPPQHQTVHDMTVHLKFTVFFLQRFHYFPHWKRLRYVFGTVQEVVDRLWATDKAIRFMGTHNHEGRAPEC